MAEPLKTPRELFGDTSRIKSRSFGKRNDGVVFNASGVVQVAPERFVFIDNHDPTAIFELTLDPDNDDLKQIRRRDLVGVTEQQLGDPEGLTRVDTDGRTYLVATSSLSVSGSRVNDGLVRISYADSGDLRAEPMAGFRSWLLAHEPALAAAAASEPDDGGVNIEGVAWDPGARALLFGVRGPAQSGQVTIVEVPAAASGLWSTAAGTDAWTTAALGAPVTRTLRVPHSAALQGIRDISYDERSGQFLILLGKSLSRKAEPFALCTWTRGADALRVTGARFGESMKPEGCTAFYRGGKRRILIVDDRGGYAVTGG
ncbi:SdiA-regulated/phytase-like domain-containing protein [Mycolicibacterium septicum]|uniref:hypothetical protein n=1 Tax=Mycolicibacterium septicum TaxID=98668 RepID=UPI001AF32128|nr:hypothetical protein [Mycolicibacterium septicum]QRY51360.1 hypothetical protein JVX95_28780 [Mycolicibacterium septicum]